MPITTRLLSNVPLRLMLIVPFVLQISLIVGLVGYLSWYTGQQAVNDVAQQLRSEVTARVINTLENYIAVPHLLNRLNANALTTGQLDLSHSDIREQYFYHQLKTFPLISNSYIGLHNGNFFGGRKVGENSEQIQLTLKDTSTLETLHYYQTGAFGLRGDKVQQVENYDIRQRPWYKAAVQAQKPTWSEIYPDAGGRGLAITAVEPIYQQNGELQAVFGSAFLLSWIHDFISTLKIGQHGQVFIMENHGLLIATSGADQTLVANSGHPPKRIFASQSNNQLIAETTQYLQSKQGYLNELKGSQQLDFYLNGERQFVQATSLHDKHGLSWLVVVVVPESDFMGQIHSNVRFTFMIIAIALLIAMLIGVLTARWIARPVMSLNSAAKSLAKGEWVQQSCSIVKRQDEIGELSQSFQTMAQQLREAFATLEDKVEERTRDLAQKNQQLVRLNQEKNEFLGIAAHDLKNPLSAIRGLSEEISEAYDDMGRHEVIEYADDIQRAAQKMFQLITNLLDVNAIESGKINVDLDNVNVLPIMETLYEDYAHRAHAKNIRSRFEIDESLDYTAYVDENTTHQILDNIISNAVKYSPPDTEFILRLKRENAAEGDWIRCEIKDQGPGLSQEDQAKLFGKFTRLTPQPTGDEHSTGLGLFIVKKLADALKGKVWCESELGQGATFIVAFPASQKL